MIRESSYHTRKKGPWGGCLSLFENEDMQCKAPSKKRKRGEWRKQQLTASCVFSVTVMILLKEESDTPLDTWDLQALVCSHVLDK